MKKKYYKVDKEFEPGTFINVEDSNMYYIKWMDSGISLIGNVWQTMDEVKDIIKENKSTETIGFKLYEDKDWVFLAQTTNDEQIRGGYFIYKKCIIEQRML